jgi:hypothetical protein
MPSGDGLPEGLYEVGRTVNLPSFGNGPQPRRQPFKASEAIAAPVIALKLRLFIPSLYNSKLSDSHSLANWGLAQSSGGLHRSDEEWTLSGLLPRV